MKMMLAMVTVTVAVAVVTLVLVLVRVFVTILLVDNATQVRNKYDASLFMMFSQLFEVLRACENVFLQ